MTNREVSSSGDGSDPDSRHQAQLMALLHDLVESEGPMKTAEVLGVNYKTVARSRESGRLSLYLKEALNQFLLTQDDPVAHASDPGTSSIEERLEKVAQCLRQAFEDALAAMEKEVNAQVEENGRQLQDVLRRLSRLEGLRDNDEPEVSTAEHGARPLQAQSYRRRHPNLVTVEPEPGEEEAYGEATLLVVAWRGLREDFSDAGNRLTRAMTEERMRGLEVTLIGDFRLTLPPAPQPWDDATRRDELALRMESLERAHRERIKLQWRRWVRRALTLGLWWN